MARYQGCPIPDTDGDGVNDEEDKCPTRVGPASNQGCLVIAKEVIEKLNFASKNVFFSTATYKLLPKSFSSLKSVADLMKSDKSLMLDIDGYTDSQGGDEYNHKLSHNRTVSVKDYLVSQDVEESCLKVQVMVKLNQLLITKQLQAVQKIVEQKWLLEIFKNHIIFKF